MNVRLYLDEDAMGRGLVRALRARGLGVETAFEAGMVEREDDEQLTYAAAQGRVLYTFNIGHFCALHADLMARGQSHAGIVVCQQQQYGIGEQTRRLLRLATRRTAEEMQNRLEFLQDWT